MEADPLFSDPDGDALTYGAASSDTAVVTVTVEGDAVTVRALARGVATIRVTAADPEGLEAATGFQVTVPNSGPEPRGALSPLGLATGDSASLDVSSHFTDPDGDALTYAVESFDPAVVAAASDGSEVTVRALARGSAVVTVTAADPDGLTAALGLEVTVINAAPTGATPIPDVELPRGAETTLDVSAHFTDPDDDPLTYGASSSDAAVAVAEASGSIVTVRGRGRGTATIMVTARDPAGLEATLSFEVAVPNGAPLVTASVSDLELASGGEAAIDASNHFTDPDGDPLTWSASSSDAAVATASVSGSVATVRALSRGAATITVTARDPASTPR